MSAALQQGVAVACVVLTGLAAYYARDCLAGVVTELIDSSDFHMSRTTYGAVSTAVFVPTIALSVVFGRLVDTFGVRRCTLAFSCTVLIGSMLTSTSVAMGSVAMLACGRVVTGVGESNCPQSQFSHETSRCH